MAAQQRRQHRDQRAGEGRPRSRRSRARRPSPRSCPARGASGRPAGARRRRPGSCPAPDRRGASAPSIRPQRSGRGRPRSQRCSLGRRTRPRRASKRDGSQAASDESAPRSQRGTVAIGWRAALSWLPHNSASASGDAALARIALWIGGVALLDLRPRPARRARRRLDRRPLRQARRRARLGDRRRRRPAEHPDRAGGAGLVRDPPRRPAPSRRRPTASCSPPTRPRSRSTASCRPTSAPG